ncbi:hypothetical protein KKC88_04350 [Patescibacteria group bacterium]|nr:hypothetical protein [Patescibacteria group bacterium]MBU1673963.1 hypothetical protein [Patescibacteria group bacterium]MBU1962962.1 hypothetical protein [Patescibacteria group bacterium]
MPENVTKILTGEGLAEELFAELKEKIDKFRVKPLLAVIMVGLDLESEGYQKFFHKAQEIGIKVETFGLEDYVEQAEVLKLIDKLNEDKRVHGILLQLPVPDDMDQNRIIDFIDPEKDVEGFHPENLGWMSLGEPRVIPSTSQAALRLMEMTGVSVKNKEVVILGDNPFLSRPLGQLFISMGGRVTVLYKLDPKVTRQADILVTTMNEQNSVKENMIKEDAVVIDMTGDVDFQYAKDKAGFITPWPAGIESLMTASLLVNTWQVMRRVEGYEEDEDFL